MSNALRDQLLKAGLVNEKQAKQALKEKQKEAKRQQGQNAPDPRAQEKLRAQQAQAEKAERDRQLNLQRQAESERKAASAQVRQLIETHRQPKGEGETPYNFIDGDRVKRLYLADDAREHVVKGRWAIVRYGNGYELVAADIADKIRARDPNCVVVVNAPTAAPQAPDADDPYAQYQVPDDLMW